MRPSYRIVSYRIEKKTLISYRYRIESKKSLSLLSDPNDLHERKTIKVAKGYVIKIHFTNFELESNDDVDYVEITDGDGTFLGRFGAKHSGSRFKASRISNITSVTDTVHVLFHTDESVARRGWRLEWSKWKLKLKGWP